MLNRIRKPSRRVRFEYTGRDFVEGGVKTNFRDLVVGLRQHEFFEANKKALEAMEILAQIGRDYWRFPEIKKLADSTRKEMAKGIDDYHKSFMKLYMMVKNWKGNE